MNVKVGTDTTKIRYVGIGTRQSGKYIQLQSNGYTLVGIGDAGWENKELSNLMNDGIKITIYSSPERFIMWIDKEKIEDTTYVYGETDTKNAFPSIVWNQGGVTLSDIQIWTPPVAELKGSSVTLDGTIGLNIYAALNADTKMTKMNFTLPNGTVQESAGTLDPATGYYKFTCKIAAKEMNDKIRAQVVAGDWMGEEYIYSVRKYADEILEDKAYEKAVPLVKAMLNYGAYAQKWFNHNVTNLANAGLTDTDVSSVTSDTLKGFAKTQQINEAVGTLGGASLILESETSLKLYFKLAEGVTTDNCSFSLKSTESTESTNLEPVESSGYYYVVIDNIDAKSLDETYEVTVTSGENSLVASYSPMTYCYNVLKGSYDENLQNVVRALYLYNAAANNYFKPNN